MLLSGKAFPKMHEKQETHHHLDFYRLSKLNMNYSMKEINKQWLVVMDESQGMIAQIGKHRHNSHIFKPNF